MMWVSANYICFDSQLMRQKFVIAFRDVIKIAKGISHFGVLDSSITIKTKQGEEVFFNPSTAVGKAHLAPGRSTSSRPFSTAKRSWPC